MPQASFVTGAPQMNSPNTLTTTFTAFYVVTTGKMCMQVFIDLYNSHTSDVLITLWVTPETNQDQSVANKRYSKTFAPNEHDKVTFRLLPAESRVFASASVAGIASIRLAAVEV